MPHRTPATAVRRLVGCCTVLLATLAGAGCQPSGTRDAAPSAPPWPSDGFYPVLGTAERRQDADSTAATHRVLLYESKYAVIPEGSAAPVEYVTIDTADHVPLILEGPPDAQKDGRGFTMLSVTLRRDQAEALERFSAAHLGGRVAIVVDGEVVTMHQVKAVLHGGRLQITRCGDDACQILYSKLTD